MKKLVSLLGLALTLSVAVQASKKRKRPSGHAELRDALLKRLPTYPTELCSLIPTFLDIGPQDFISAHQDFCNFDYEFDYHLNSEDEEPNGILVFDGALLSPHHLSKAELTVALKNLQKIPDAKFRSVHDKHLLLGIWHSWYALRCFLEALNAGTPAELYQLKPRAELLDENRDKAGCEHLPDGVSSAHHMKISFLVPRVIEQGKAQDTVKAYVGLFLYTLNSATDTGEYCLNSYSKTNRVSASSCLYDDLHSQICAGRDAEEACKLCEQNPLAESQPVCCGYPASVMARNQSFDHFFAWLLKDYSAQFPNFMQTLENESNAIGDPVGFYLK